MLVTAIAFLALMSDGGGQSTTSAVPGAPGSPLRPGAFVEQNVSEPKCGWYGCFGDGSSSISVSDGKKWMDVGGLKGDDMSNWPDFGLRTMWQPYATSGVYFDGGIRAAVPGDLITVNPPKERYGFPYNMRPMWQEGPADLNEYYKRKCKIRTRGTLYYRGPDRSDGGTGGGYVWRYKNNVEPGAMEIKGGSGIVNQPPPQFAKDKMNDADQTIQWLKDGIELPPWERRGPYAMDSAIRQVCK